VNLILLDADELQSNGEVTLSGRRAAHLLDVLAGTMGQTVRVGVIDGPRGTGTVLAATPGAVTLHCVLEPAPPPVPSIDLLLALPRPKVMRRLWAQIAALGVGQIIVTNAWRVERDYFATHMLAEAFFRPLLLEGLQQAGDTRLPRVSIQRRFRVMVEDALDELFPHGTRLVAEPGAETPVAAAARIGRDERLLLAIGPEGGWSEFELALLDRHRFHRVGMGARTLRVDTACTALLAIAHAARQLPSADTGSPQ
jgi:RsmE family RNA methyltransferase